MSEPRPILLAGATGLVGTRVMEAAPAHGPRLVALTRREAAMPAGARMDMLIADPRAWAESVAVIRPGAVICALGTTWRKAGGDEEAFRAVDEELVLQLARAALTAGARNFVFVSSVGADARSRNFYLRVKGEVEARLRKLGFRRLDILRPGLLRGPREADRRLGERIGIAFSPLMNLALHGARRPYRAIDARIVAAAALRCCDERAAGTFTHDHDGLRRLARRLDGAA